MSDSRTDAYVNTGEYKLYNFAGSECEGIGAEPLSIAGAFDKESEWQAKERVDTSQLANTLKTQLQNGRVRKLVLEVPHTRVIYTKQGRYAWLNQGLILFLDREKYAIAIGEANQFVLAAAIIAEDMRHNGYELTDKED